MIRVILAEPEHDLNVGSAARAMKNFGCSQLFLVRPQCRLGFEAMKFAKHSKEILDNAKKTNSLEKALAGIDFSIATTGAPRRYRTRLKNLLPLKEAVEKISPSEKTALVFGSEGSGLAWEQLRQCDVVATIPANFEHPVLNLSHAVAVCLYECFTQNKVIAKDSLPRKRLASREKRKDVAKLFQEIVREIPVVRYPEKVSTAFENVLGRARPTEEEIRALYAPLGPLYRFAKKIGDLGTGKPLAKRSL